MFERRVEWPTVLLAVAIHAEWVALLIWHDRLPAVAAVALLAVVTAWFGSLEHEVIHRHPTSSERVNRWFVALPLTLWVPFARYRELHLAHHRDELTIPGVDPESFYIRPEEWERMSPTMRRLHWANRTLAVRLTIGPLLQIARFWRGEPGVAATDRQVRHVWLDHLARVAVVVVLVAWSGMPTWEYLMGAVYGSTVLIMLRSFAEHCAVDGMHRPNDADRRTAVVRSAGFFGILYLHNNLHVTHHLRPWVPWYELPETHDQLGSDEIAADSAGLYGSYAEVVRRFLFRPFCQPAHPILAASER